MRKLFVSCIDLFLMSVFILCFFGLQAQPETSTIEIKAPVVEVCYNASNRYSVTVTAKSFLAMRSFDLTLNYDKTEFGVTSITPVAALGGSFSWNADPVTGKINLKWHNAAEISIGESDYSALFDIKFNVLNFPNNSGDNLFDSSLTWDGTVSKFYSGDNWTGYYSIPSTAFVNGTLNVPVAYPTVDYMVTQPSCADGQALITINSPVGTGINYYFNGSTTPSTTGQATVLAHSANTVRIKDANGCYSHLFAIPVGGPHPLVFAVSAENPDCSRDNGEIQFDVSGGTLPYAYFIVPTEEFAAFQAQLTIQGGAATAPYFAPYKNSNFQVLKPAGIYRVAVTDANGCIDLSNPANWKTATITEPAPIAFNVQFADASPCVVGQTGSISISSISGGTAPYSFVVANAGTAVPVDGWAAAPGTITSLTPNYYSVWVKDGNGCVVGFDNPDGTGNVLSIQSPMEPMISASVTWNNDVTCHGGNDGRFTVNATGGVAPYKYAAKKSALPVSVSAPDLNSAEWQTSNIFDQATAGTWIVWVKDKNGCMVGGEGTTIPVNEWRVQVDEPSGISFTPSATDVGCHGTTGGKITVNPVGGAGSPYSFTISGTDADGNMVDLNYSGLTSINGVYTLANVLASETRHPSDPTHLDNAYTVKVTERNGCSVSKSVVVWQDAPLAAEVEVTNATCAGTFSGRLTISATGGSVRPVYAIANDLTSLDNPAIYNGVGAGIYTETTVAKQTLEVQKGIYYISIKDPECSSSKIVKGPIIVDGYNAITFTGTVSKTDATAISVADGTITVPLVGVKGGKPEFDGSGDYIFSLSKPVGATVTNSTGIFTGLAVGTYTVTIKDESGCAGATVTATILNPDIPAGTKQLNITAGNLSAALTATEKATITNLILTGTIDARDFKTMRDEMPFLESVNLSGATIKEYNGIGGTSGTGSWPNNEIPELAFQKCSRLTTIIFPSSITSIGGGAFEDCIGLTTVSIPSSVTSIGGGAFWDCVGLTTLTIPSSVTSIEGYTFYNCSGLTAIFVSSTTPANLTNSPFVFAHVNKSNCVLYVPFGLKNLYSVAAQWKDFLNIVEMPSFTLSKTEIAFKPTIDKTTVELTITNGTAWQASSDADWLKVSPTGNDNSAVLVVEATENTSSNIRTGKITVTATNAEPKTITVTQAGQEQVLELTIHVQTPGTLFALLSAAQKSSVKRLTVTGVIDARDFKTIRDDMPLLEFLDLSGVTIAAYTGTEGTAGTDVISYPANAIPDYAFCKPDTLVGKTTLVSFNFPETVTIIKNTAFGGCIGLSNLIIPSTVTTIERNTFIGCTGLSGNLNIPSLVTFVGSGAFGGCIQLTVVTVPASLVTIEPNAFDSHALINVSAQNPNYSSIEGVFINKDQTTLIQFPKVKTGTYRIPSTIINIGKDAFIDCTQLDGVNIPISVKTIGDESFKGCTHLTGIILPSSLTSIGFRAFYNCTELKTFNIPASVTSIGSEAFRNCAGLELIYAYSPLPIDLSNSSSVFEGVNKTTCKLYVPYGSKPAYQSADKWKDFLSIIEMPGLKLSADSIRLAGAQDSSITVDLSSNTSWTIYTSASWLKFSPSSGEGNQKLTISADASVNQIRDAAIALYISGNPAPFQLISVIQDKDVGSIPGFTISTPNQEQNLGMQIEVPVYTSQLDASSNIISYQFNLDYDHTKLQYVDKSFSGTIAPGGNVVVNANTPGRLQVSYMRSTPISGTGTLIKLKFNTLTAGTTGITVSSFFYNSTFGQSINNGSVTVNDNTPPTAFITYSDLDGLLKPGDKLTITATFNEPMAESPVPQITLGGANNLTAINMTRVSNTIYTFEHTVANGNGDVYVSLASGTDLYGNLVAEMPVSGRIFWIDNVQPQVLLTYSDPDLKVRAGDEITITATFSEAMAESSIPEISLSEANTLAETAMTKVSSTVYTYKYTVVNGDGDVNVHVSGATDIAGNLVVEPTTGNAFQVTPFRYGDVDDNGFIQAYDAALALQYSVGLDPLPTNDPIPWNVWRTLATDIDDYTGITANDAALILQYSANIISKFPVEDMTKSGIIDDTDVRITIENGYLVFRSVGNLLGLNVIVEDNIQYMGEPKILNPEMISATNISATGYSIGIATAKAPNEGDVFMKIPYSVKSNTSVTLNMIVNTTKKQAIVGLTTGIEKSHGKEFLIYPNPTSKTLFITGSDDILKISIYDLNRRLISDYQVENNQIDVSKLSVGVYLLKVESAKGIETAKFVKK